MYSSSAALPPPQPALGCVTSVTSQCRIDTRTHGRQVHETSIVISSKACARLSDGTK